MNPAFTPPPDYPAREVAATIAARDVNTAALRCEGCGCTDERACHDPATGEACAWIVAEPDVSRALCSVCARILVSVSAETRRAFRIASFRVGVLQALGALAERIEAAAPLVVLADAADTPETVAAKCRAARSFAERFEALGRKS